MKFDIAAVALFGASALATPLVERDETLNYKIKDFTARKLDGYTTSTVFFNLTDGANFNIACTQNGLKGAKVDEAFEQNKIYACSADSPFSWVYKSGDSVKGTDATLSMFKERNLQRSLAAEVNFPEPTNCRKGPSTVASTDPTNGGTICEITTDIDIVFK